MPQLYPAVGPVLVAAALRAWGSAAQDKTTRSWAWFGLGIALAALGFDGTRQLRAQLAGPLASMLPIVGGGVLALWAHTGYVTWKQLDPRPAHTNSS